MEKLYTNKVENVVTLENVIKASHEGIHMMKSERHTIVTVDHNGKRTEATVTAIMNQWKEVLVTNDANLIYTTFLRLVMGDLIEKMARKQLRNRTGLSRHLSHEDIANEVYARAMEGRVKCDPSQNIRAILFLTVQNVTRTYVDQLKKENKKFDFDEIEVTDTYETWNAYEGDETEAETVEYNRKEYVIKGVRQVKRRADVRTMITKAVPSYASGVDTAVDFRAMFTEEEMQIIHLLKEGYGKKEINETMGKRCDRIFDRIAKMAQDYAAN